MTCYFATFQPNGDGFIVTFADVPEAITEGDDLDEARANAQDALEVALLTYVLDEQELPVPLSTTGEPVAVSARTAVKIAFIEAFRHSGMTRVELARRLGKGENEVRRMLDPYHHTKLSSMEAGLRSLGKQLVISVQDAA